MVSSFTTSVPQPIPLDLRKVLSQPQTPWNVNPQMFARLQAQNSNDPYRLCEVLNSEPEFEFILRYFEYQKPPGYCIKRVVCIHNPDQTGFFEMGLKNMERECNNSVFAPRGKEEEPREDRARVLKRWEGQVAQFSSVEIINLSSRKKDVFEKVRVLPLWHGSSKEVCLSICSSGYTSFGKHHYFHESAQKGSATSKDKGYFGSGIYFTNSARYAAMYSSEGQILLTWVSMREPYPVVNDKPHPEKGTDMIKLGGKEHYQNYNAHFIPVASIKPEDPQCLEYYPCYKDQPPTWDEFVVFEKSQTLPRFWIELGVDLPKSIPEPIPTIGDFITRLKYLTQNLEIKKDRRLYAVLSEKFRSYYIEDDHPTQKLSDPDKLLFERTKQLLDNEGNINPTVASFIIQQAQTKELTKAPPAPPPRSDSLKNPTLKSSPRPKSMAVSKASSLPPITVNNLPFPIQSVAKLLPQPPAAPNPTTGILAKPVPRRVNEVYLPDHMPSASHPEEIGEKPTSLPPPPPLQKATTKDNSSPPSARPKSVAISKLAAIVAPALSEPYKKAFSDQKKLEPESLVPAASKPKTGQSIFLENSTTDQQEYHSISSVISTGKELGVISLQLMNKEAIPAIAFGKEQWETFFGNIGDAPELPSEIKGILKRICPFNPGKRVGETHLLTLIPKMVNNQLLTLNHLENLIKHPLRRQRVTKYAYYFDEIKKMYGAKSLDKSYWVLMTKDVIPKSRTTSYEAQIQLLKEQNFRFETNYEIPTLLEAAVSILIEYLWTGTRLYSSDPQTYTRCQEHFSNSFGKTICIVGGFSSEGIIINRSDSHGLSYYGIAGVRRF